MAALFIWVITSEIFVTLEKSTVLPFIDTCDADGIFEKLRFTVTKLDPAVTFVDDVNLAAVAFAAAEELDVPTDVSLILMSCELAKH